jgi:hypothetical protein
MVLDVEPVADLLAVTVDGQRLAGEGIVDAQRDELFREVVGAVVVGAVGGERRQAVGVVVGADSFEQAEGADDVGLDEVFRAMDAAVDVRFGGEINDGARLVLGEQPGDKIEIADVALDEEVARVAAQGCEVLEIAGVGEHVEDEDGFIGLGQRVEDEVAADEASTAGDENSHIYSTVTDLARFRGLSTSVPLTSAAW